jgi:hypothetical protein
MEVLMTCQRCGGFMIIERFQDIQDQTGQITFQGFRCVSCGEVIDPSFSCIGINIAGRDLAGNLS